MSYEIFYDKQFIKLPNNQFIPMVLCGSNNCYDVSYNGRDRRSRDWSVLTYALKGKRYGTPDEYIAAIEAQKLSSYENSKSNSDEKELTLADFEKNFGWYSSLAIKGSTRKTTFGMYKGIFTTGFAKALTVEQLREENVYTRVYSYAYESKTYEKHGLEAFDITVSTSEELVELLAAKDAMYKDTGINIYVTIDASEQKMTRLRKKLFPMPSKRDGVWIDITGYYVLENERGYFVKRTSKGYRYTPYADSSGTKVFLTEKEANEAAKKGGTFANWKPLFMAKTTRVKVSQKIAEKYTIKDLVV